MVDSLLIDLGHERRIEYPLSHLAMSILVDAINGQAGACPVCGESVVDTLRSGDDGTTCLVCLKDDEPDGLFITVGTDHFNAWAPVAEVDCCDRHALNPNHAGPCAAWLDSDESEDGCEVVE